MHFAWIRSWEANKQLFHELLFANASEFLAAKAPKCQIGLPTVVKTTCSLLPFFSLSLMVSSKSVKALSLK